ncbi:PGF-pre-PGF domain-containing protein [uncultured Methanomethylovorans sp.]|uniref:PGF-pre-PGF domain-containing protein n=1 Tax=uncultured Methanomethylovorans sp. TaxID=183759 RepID=UPI002AA7FB24|nr:PGF-pre-PGF domain-containing protein [uncultured Methanomethylovorans sp.]
MQLKLSGPINIGLALFCMIIIAGMGSAEELNVNFAGQFDENTYDAASITNALVTDGQGFTSHFGGSISNVVVVGNYAYAAQGQDMLVIDVTKTSNPSEVGKLTTLSLINSIVVEGNYAYIANGDNGLQVVDITNPTAPTIVGTYTYNSGAAYGVTVANNYAYVANGNSGLVIVDITNPAAPTFKGRYDTPGYAYGISVVGNYAYVADGGNGLVIVDVTNPAAPTSLSSYDTVKANAVTVSGNYAYVADDSNGLVIVDITNPAAATYTGKYDTQGNATCVAIEGNYAYVADGSSGLSIVNISNPATPSSTAVYSATPGYAYSIDVVDNYAYIAYGRTGLAIINISKPSAPSYAGIYDVAGFASGVAIADNYAYVAYGYMGLTVVDITNPAAPTRAGSYITTGYARDVAVAGNYAYIADGSTGLVIVDVKNPSSPSLEGSYNTNTDGKAWGVTVADNYAYLADGSSGLVVIDVTNPASPTLKGSYNTAGNAENVAISGNYAYVADGDNGLVVLDITKPATPALEGSYNTPGHAYGVSIVGNYAYVADGSDGLVVLDVTNPAAPTIIGNYDTNFAQNIAVAGNYAYIADDSFGLVIVDITNPTVPTLAGSYDTAGYGYGVAVLGNYVYVADFNNGLVILSVDNGSDTNPPASVTDLKEISAGSSWIKWAWVNPSDADFSHVMVFIDGAFVENAVGGVYELTGLTEGTTHTISTKTVDISGNTNPTWVNDSAVATTTLPSDTTPPGSVTNLEETNADSHWINWTWINPEDDDFSYVMVYIDGEFVTNTTDSSINSYNATELSKGTTYTIGLQTVDTSGNINSVLVNDSATAIKLPKVLNLAGTNITKTSITLLWENSEDTTEVKISRDDMALGNASGSTSYVDSNLSSGKSYTYTLVPYNEDGVEGKAVTAKIKTKSSSSGGSGGSSSSRSSSSSSGGSGGATSVEDYSNLALKDVANAYLRIDTNVTYEFTKEGNPIQSVSLYSLKNSGQITSTIEVLNNRSKLANSTPEGQIYKYANIWVGKAGFATASNIKDAQIQFKVNSSWIQDMGLNPEDVKLQRYNGTTWEILPTTLESNATGYVVYEAQTPGFSPFAITAEKELASSPSSETEVQNINSNATSVTKDTKVPGFDALFAIVGMLAVAYLIRKS